MADRSQWLAGSPTLLLVGFAALVFTGFSSVFGQWIEVDNFQLVPGFSSASRDLGQDSNGMLYSVGRGDTATGSYGVIRISKDAGDNWATLAPSLSLNVSGFFTAFAADLRVNGPIYVGTYAGQIFRSDDEGTTWKLDGVFEYTPGGGGILLRMAVDPLGNVYAVGRDATKILWVVRKRNAVTGIWNTVDAISKNACFAWDVACHPTAGVFVVGYVNNVWTVRKSKDGSSGSWSTVDSYQLVKGSTSRAGGIAVDSAGSVYVVGSNLVSINRVNGSVWSVRRSDNGGATWATVDTFPDTFQYPNYPYNQPNGATVDNGTVYVGGGASSNTSGAWLIRQATLPNSSTDWQMCDEVASVSVGDGVSAIRSFGPGNILATGSLNIKDGSGSHWITHKPSVP
jgi:hypothetical protein